MTRTWGLCMVPALLACLLVGCGGDQEPCYGLRVGQRVELDIVERYDASSQFPGATSRPEEACPSEHDLTAGGTLVLVVEQQTSHEVLACEASHFNVENGGDVGWDDVVSKNAGQLPTNKLVSVFSATFGGCGVGIDLSILPRRQTSDLFAVSEPGAEPYFVLRRQFYPGNCSLPACRDDFVVNFKKIQ